jgi:hypothetical protein
VSCLGVEWNKPIADYAIQVVETALVSIKVS